MNLDSPQRGTYAEWIRQFHEFIHHGCLARVDMPEVPEGRTSNISIICVTISGSV